MLFALLSDINTIGPIEQFFPVTSFPSTGPTDAWLTENNVARVYDTRPYDPAAQVQEDAAPYLQDGAVYTVTVRDLTPQEIAERAAAQAAQNQAQNKSQASAALAATDWTEIPAVTDHKKPVYLANKSEFDAYRTALRLIAVEPPDTVIAPSDWPVRPTEKWNQAAQK